MTTFYNKNLQANLIQMPFPASKDKDYGDCYIDISKTEKRLIRTTLKNYENSGTSFFLKFLREKTMNMKLKREYLLQQRNFSNL